VRTSISLLLLVLCLFILGIERVSAASFFGLFGSKADVWDGGSEPFGGEGTQEKPYVIDTAKKLAYLAIQVNGGNNYEGKFFKLDKDIDLAQKQWTPIGDVEKEIAFDGNFSGDGHTISNLTVNMPGSTHVGLFTAIGENGDVGHLKIADVEVIGQNIVGGLAGLSRGRVTGVTVRGGNVTATTTNGGTAGGLIGISEATSLTSNCEAGVNVKGNVMVGGLIGGNDSGRVFNSTATGNVKGKQLVGGLIGYNGGDVTDCKATGKVTGVSNVGELVGENVEGGKIVGSAAADTGSKASGKLVDVAREGIRLALLYGTDQKALEKELGKPSKVDNFQGTTILTHNRKGIRIEVGVDSGEVIDFLYFIPIDRSYGVSNDGMFATVAQVAREMLQSQGVGYDGADKGLRFDISGHTLDIMGDEQGVMMLSNMTMNSGVIIHAYY
jgi:hypothetical protein